MVQFVLAAETTSSFGSSVVPHCWRRRSMVFVCLFLVASNHNLCKSESFKEPFISANDSLSLVESPSEARKSRCSCFTCCLAMLISEKIPRREEIASITRAASTGFVGQTIVLRIIAYISLLSSRRAEVNYFTTARINRPQHKEAQSSSSIWQSFEVLRMK